MSLECPEGCDSMPRSCPIYVDPDIFANAKAREFENFKGIDSATGKIKNENPTLVFDIDQSEYATNNHFKNRDTFEHRDNAIVKDIKDGRVEVEFLSVQKVLTVMECPECETIYEPDTGQVFPEPNKKYS